MYSFFNSQFLILNSQLKEDFRYAEIINLLYYKTADLSIIKEGWFKTNPLYVIYFTPLKASYALNITVACALVAVPLGSR